MLSCCFKESNEDITLNLSCQHEIGVLSILTFSVTEKKLTARSLQWHLYTTNSKIFQLLCSAIIKLV